MLHIALYDCVRSRVVRCGGELGDAEIAIHGGYYTFHELTSFVIPKYEWDTLLKDKSRELSSRDVFLLAIR